MKESRLLKLHFGLKCAKFKHSSRPSLWSAYNVDLSGGSPSSYNSTVQNSELFIHPAVNHLCSFLERRPLFTFFLKILLESPPFNWIYIITINHRLLGYMKPARRLHKVMFPCSFLYYKKWPNISRLMTSYLVTKATDLTNFIKMNRPE